MREMTRSVGVAVVAGFLGAAPSFTQAQQVQTLRYDMPTAALGIFNLELVQDFFFPVEPAEIVKTRFDLTFQTNTFLGEFDAAQVGLALQPPVPSADPNDPLVLTQFFTGSDFGWSGNGTFTFNGETDMLNGVALPAPPGAGALLYGVTHFNALRLNDPNDTTPMGGQYINNSAIEIDYVLIPEPAMLSLPLLVGVIAARRRI